MSAPIAAMIQASNPVLGRALLLLAVGVAPELPCVVVPGELPEASWPCGWAGGELVVGAGAGEDGAVGEWVEGALPAKGSLYCSFPALWANAAAGTSSTAAQKAASRRPVMRPH
jgi:hypothetical protein